MSGYVIPSDWGGETYKCYQVKWPDSAEWEALLRGALSGFDFDYVWDAETGDVAEAVATAQEIISLNTVGGRLPPECENKMVPGMVAYLTVIPPGGFPGWTWAGGQGLTIDCEYRDLLIAAGYPFGGSGDQPKVPDLTDKVLRGTNLSNIGVVGGLAEVTLTVGEMPSHNHDYENQDGQASYAFIRNTISPTHQTLGTGAFTSPGYHTANVGGGQPHENWPPNIQLFPLVYLGEIY